MSFSTTWRWMRVLGFRYDTRKKSFNVDGHERDDVVANRKDFCCRHWVQLSVVEADTIKELDRTSKWSSFILIIGLELQNS